MIGNTTDAIQSRLSRHLWDECATVLATRVEGAAMFADIYGIRQLISTCDTAPRTLNGQSCIQTRPFPSRLGRIQTGIIYLGNSLLNKTTHSKHIKSTPN
jgi:hypothetical protein